MERLLAFGDAALVVLEPYGFALDAARLELIVHAVLPLSHALHNVHDEHLRRHTEQEYAEEKYKSDDENERPRLAEAPQKRVSEQAADDAAADPLGSVGEELPDIERLLASREHADEHRDEIEA